MPNKNDKIVQRCNQVKVFRLKHKISKTKPGQQPDNFVKLYEEYFAIW